MMLTLIDNVRGRAKAIIVEAETLVAKHGRAADEIVREFERNANSLGASFYWRAVKKVVSTRVRSDVDLLPPMKANNCTTCLVEVIAGTHEAQGLPLPLACGHCVGQLISHSSQLKWVRGDPP